jgi:hypothetical protein
MGLLISDSFKTVVTIYILIPFLVIPQIILSGIIVKFENLNPTISSPERIPIYGEIITARWAYEALATYQFMENDYQKNFYLAEKKKSVAEFNSDFLLKNLQNKLSYVISNFEENNDPEKISYNLMVIRDELEKERERRKVFKTYCDEIPGYKLTEIDKLYPDQINLAILQKTEAYIKALSEEYKLVYRNAFHESNNIKQTFSLDTLQEMKRKHHNTSLEEFVTNKNEFEKIVEYKGKLIQKTKPIYLDPMSRMVKAHFYAPRKMVFGNYIPTIWVNIIVIWLMTFLLYLALYFRLLKKLLDFFENLSK